MIRQVTGLLLLISVNVWADGFPTLPDPDTEIARRHFDQGTALYYAGKYAVAIVEFEAAWKTKPSPAFDYNIGRCHDRLEHTVEAIGAYERYVASSPSDAAEVVARIEVLKQRLVARVPIFVPVSVATPAMPNKHRVATWVVGGAGVALLAGSLVAGLVADSQYNTLKNSCGADGACSTVTLPNAQSLIDSGHAAGLAADVMLAVGIAAVVAGVVLFFVEGRHVERYALAPYFGNTGFSFEGLR